MKIAAIIASVAILSATAATASESKPNEYLPHCAAAYNVTSVIHNRAGSAESKGYAKIALAFQKAANAELGEARAMSVARQSFTNFMNSIDRNEPGSADRLTSMVKNGCPSLGASFKVGRFL
jgi:hypothetical protein